MAKNREAFTAHVLKLLEAIAPGNTDTARWKSYLEGLNSKAFDEFVNACRTGEKYLTLTVPNFSKVKLSLERNFAVADKFKIKLFHRVWEEGGEDTPTFLSPYEYLVCKVPVRLASQRLAKKASIPKTQRIINTLTGQPTGDSKGASISYPELRLCVAMGLENTMVELMKYRGGDVRGGAALNASLMKTGRANLKTLSHFASGVESTNTLRTYLTGAMLRPVL